MAASKRGSWDEQISRLREQKEKKEQGLSYRVDDIFNEKKSGGKKQASGRTAAKKEAETPYVKKITLDELIDKTRAEKGEKPLDRGKKTPFISREKELKSPELSKAGKN
ncbi:MAG: hypothetical protein LUD81_11260 [Clostridiales bacterium]|nr:hypothetical protein [Clostridiales bacterium]